MKSKLQYIYSISVFVGVLATAYLMMNKDGSAGFAFRSFESPTLKTEAGLADPAVTSLLEMEDALTTNLKKEKAETLKRGISRTKSPR